MSGEGEDRAHVEGLHLASLGRKGPEIVSVRPAHSRRSWFKRVEWTLIVGNAVLLGLIIVTLIPPRDCAAEKAEGNGQADKAEHEVRPPVGRNQPDKSGNEGENPAPNLQTFGHAAPQMSPVGNMLASPRESIS